MARYELQGQKPGVDSDWETVAAYEEAQSFDAYQDWLSHRHNLSHTSWRVVSPSGSVLSLHYGTGSPAAWSRINNVWA